MFWDYKAGAHYLKGESFPIKHNLEVTLKLWVLVVLNTVVQTTGKYYWKDKGCWGRRAIWIPQYFRKVTLPDHTLYCFPVPVLKKYFITVGINPEKIKHLNLMYKLNNSLV